MLENTTGFNATKNFNFLEGLNIAFGSNLDTKNSILIKVKKLLYASYDINGNVVTASTPRKLYVTNPDTGNVRPGGSQGFPGYSENVGKAEITLQLT